jgi:hypothetical protein
VDDFIAELNQLKDSLKDSETRSKQILERAELEERMSKNATMGGGKSR